MAILIAAGYLKCAILDPPPSLPITKPITERYAYLAVYGCV